MCPQVYTLCNTILHTDVQHVTMPVDGSPTINEEPSLVQKENVYQYAKGFFLSEFEMF